MLGVRQPPLAGQPAPTEERARRVAARGRRLGYAETARLGPGRPWVWLSRRGLTACGLAYTAAPPALSRLAHLRAVAVTRLALESAPSYPRSRPARPTHRRPRAPTGGPARPRRPA